MRRWIRLAVGLYPSKWRKRYGAELDALLEDVRPGWRDFWDVLQGAMTMQMRVWSLGKVAAACGLAGALIAAVVAFQMDNRYVSYAVMRLQFLPADGKTNDGAVAERLGQIQEDVLSRRSLAQIVMHADLYKRERERLPLEDILMSMRNRDIRIAPVKPAAGATTTAFLVQFSYRDPVAAQRTTRELISAMQYLATKLSPSSRGVNLEVPATKLSPGFRGVNLEVLDPASLPQRPVFPNRLMITLAGLAGGLALSAAFMGIRRVAKS